jgi:hypothetical protein
MATHLIHFPDPEQHKKAIRVLHEVPLSSLGIPGYQFVVSDEHIEALKRAGIRFVDRTKVIPNGSATPVQP